MTPKDFHATISLLQFIVGARNVLTEKKIIDEQITAFKTEALSANNRIMAIVKPKNKRQIEEVLFVSNELGIPAYPFSKRKNWTYNTIQSVRNPILLVDLT